MYGLGARPSDLAAVARVFAQKQRPQFDPLIVHAADAETAFGLSFPSDTAERLASAFWPGPLTLVLSRRTSVPDLVTAGLPTVGVRVPDHWMALALLRDVGPLAAPSANPFGRISPTSAAHVEEGLGADVPVVDGGPCRVGVESTVLWVQGAEVVLLRPGGIPVEQVSSLLGREVDRAVGNEIRSPGQLTSHYAPRTPVHLGDACPPGPRWGWIGIGQPTSLGWAAVESLGDADVVAATRLFSALRRLDAAGLDGIVAVEPPETGLYAAVADRLRRAAGRPC